MDVAVIDVPAILALAIPAAGEFGHAPMIATFRPDGKPLGVVGQGSSSAIAGPLDSFSAAAGVVPVTRPKTRQRRSQSHERPPTEATP
jgi:hypothetical protein